MEEKYKFMELREEFLESIVDKVMRLDEEFDRAKSKKVRSCISGEAAFLLQLRKINMN